MGETIKVFGEFQVENNSTSVLLPLLRASKGLAANVICLGTVSLASLAAAPQYLSHPGTTLKELENLPFVYLGRVHTLL